MMKQTEHLSKLSDRLFAKLEWHNPNSSMEHDAADAAQDFDAQEDEKLQTVLLHRLHLFERGLFAPLVALETGVAEREQHAAFNESALADRIAQVRAKQARELVVGACAVLWHCLHCFG